MMHGQRVVEVTIADGESLSGAIKIPDDECVVGVEVPAGWTTAVVSFEGSRDDITYTKLQDDGGEYSTGSLAAGERCSVTKEVFYPVNYLKVRSGTSGAAVAQADGDVVLLILRRLS